MKSLLLVFLLQYVCYTTAYKILVVYPLPIMSVNFLGQGVVRQLLKDGHEVTYISTHPIKEPHSKKLRQIDISQNRAFFEKPNDTTWSIKTVLDDKFEAEMTGYLDSSTAIAQLTFANENVTNLLQNSNEHFDAVIADWMESDVYSGLSVLYNCPMMWVFSMGTHWQVLRLISDPPSPAYVTDFYGANIPPFTFTQRVQELYSRIRWSLHKTFYIKPIEREVYKNTFAPLLAKNGRTLPDYDEIIYNASIIFANEHNAVLGRPSTPQNFKFIGGIHIDDPVKPLPQDLQDLIDNASHGVIYFSMGSFLKSKELPMKFVRDVLSVFGELKETVIWKYEDNLEDIPKNVHIVKWAPQQSILAHPNCKFFISHGGLLSTIETIHFGKPIIGVPVLLDQITNINKAVDNGFAIKVKLDYNMPTNLKSAIKTMLSDDSYEKRAKELSFIYHDRPMKPGDELIYWVRHVLRTRGAWHLRSPAINVPLYQRLYLDLVALIIVCIFILWRFLNAALKTKSEPRKNIAKKKKNVTYIAGDPLDIPQGKNFHQIDVSVNRAILKDFATWNVGNLLKYKKVENELKGMQDFCRVIAEMTFSNENVTKFLENTNVHFDAVVADLIESEVYAGLGVLYNTPMLWFFSMGAHWQVIRLIADPSNPTYDADYYGGNIPPFSFTQRVQELYSRARWMAYKTFYTLPGERAIYEKTFGPLLAKRGRTLPDYEEVIYNASMIFGNEHNAIVNRPSTPQNFKYIGGIHIDEPVQPLPKNLQDLMDKSPQGVIYFSMGTFLQSKDLPMQFVRDLLEVLGEVKQTVIWKYEEDLKDVPKNVHIVKWAPQHSILAHPNCKFFISHGGLLSSIETVHFGIPIIGVPGMLDQITNVDKAVANGYAIKVNLDSDMPKNLRVAIKTMLSDDKYEKKVKELSFIYHDRPMKPGDELNYWVQHVVKTRGAWHLRSPAINVPLYQRLYLDLVALVLGIVFVLCSFLKMVLKKTNKTERNLAKKKKN